MPIISETTKRSFHQSTPGGSTAVQDERDATRPSSAVVRSVFSVAFSLIGFYLLSHPYNSNVLSEMLFRALTIATLLF